MDGVETNLTVDLKANSLTGLDTGHVDRAISGSVLYAVPIARNTVRCTAAGVHAQMSSDNKLQFVGDSNQSIEVQAAGDVNNYLGAGAWSGARSPALSVGRGRHRSRYRDGDRQRSGQSADGQQHRRRLPFNRCSINMALDTDYARSPADMPPWSDRAACVTTGTGGDSV